MNAVKPGSSTGAVDTATLRECQQHALLAKEQVFKAQDKADAIRGDEKLRARARALLWRARGALEELDNLVLCKTEISS